MSLALLFATILGVYSLWRGGEWVLNCLVYENRAFAIREIDIRTDGVITLDQLRRWSGVRLGQNLYALDLGQVRRNLELVPSIQSASPACIPPHTLRIRVVEREALAQVNVPRPRPGGGIELLTFYVDATGQVMLPLDPRQRAAPPSQPPEDLPLIAGLNSSELQTGRRIEAPSVQAALQLIVAFESSPMYGLVGLKRIDVSSPDALQVSTSQGSDITFGLANFEDQLLSWHLIFEQAQKLNQSIATLDLSVTDNIPARCVDASSMPPSGTAKPPKTPRKKHV